MGLLWKVGCNGNKHLGKRKGGSTEESKSEALTTRLAVLLVLERRCFLMFLFLCLANIHQDRHQATSTFVALRLRFLLFRI